MTKYNFPPASTVSMPFADLDRLQNRRLIPYLFRIKDGDISIHSIGKNPFSFNLKGLCRQRGSCGESSPQGHQVFISRKIAQWLWGRFQRCEDDRRQRLVDCPRRFRSSPWSPVKFFAYPLHRFLRTWRPLPSVFAEEAQRKPQMPHNRGFFPHWATDFPTASFVTAQAATIIFSKLPQD